MPPYPYSDPRWRLYAPAVSKRFNGSLTRVTPPTGGCTSGKSAQAPHAGLKRPFLFFLRGNSLNLILPAVRPCERLSKTGMQITPHEKSTFSLLLRRTRHFRIGSSTSIWRCWRHVRYYSHRYRIAALRQPTKRANSRHRPLHPEWKLHACPIGRNCVGCRHVAVVTRAFRLKLFSPRVGA